MNNLDLLSEYLSNKPAVQRSPQWAGVEHQHLLLQPACQGCGTKQQLNVHHIRPFHIHPELELDSTNLITLCMQHNCHFLIGHCLDWKLYNPNVIRDAAIIFQMIQGRQSV